MLINEVVVKEAYREDLLIAVQDLLTYAMKRNIAKISTEKFKSAILISSFSWSTSPIIELIVPPEENTAICSPFSISDIIVFNALIELDLKLREFDPVDPVKYDYALFGLGAFEAF